MHQTNRTLSFATTAAALALAAPAAASVNDFRLPEPGQQPAVDRQGPVVPDVPESRVRPTPNPTASRPPAPAPTAAAPVVTESPQVEPSAASSPVRTTRSTGAPTAAASRTPALTGLPATEPVATSELGLPAASTSPSPVPTTSTIPPTGAATPDEAPWWPWVVAVLAGLAALGFGGWSWWQRRPKFKPVAPAEIERPRMTPALASEDGPVQPLHIALEPLRLSLTLINATLSYRLEVANRGLAPVEGLAIGADMISAHASLSREQQLSGPVNGAATIQHIDRLDPGESRIVEGEFRVPFTQIVPIRQGNAALLLPLARFRLAAQGAEPVVRTFVVGQPGAKSGLQPFRLDQGPRIYPKLAQRAFA